MSLWIDTAQGSYSLHYYQAGRIRTRCLEAGQRDREAVVFLHGTGGHLEAYVRNVLPHAEHFRAFAIDLIGHGFSDKPDHPYEIKDYVRHLVDFCDAAGPERIHLSGESLGGWIAARVALDHPERVGKLVLNMAGGLITDPAVPERLRMLSLKAVAEPSRENVRKRLEFLMADPATVTDDPNEG